MTPAFEVLLEQALKLPEEERANSPRGFYAASSRTMAMSHVLRSERLWSDELDHRIREVRAAGR